MSITVHHADSCPYCVRIRLVLNGKGINADLIDVDLSNKPPYLRELNPRNRVPVIEHEGHVISESEALNEYLNEIAPDPPMMPANPAARARVRMLMRRFEDVTDAYYAARRGEDGGREELDAELAWVEALLEKDPYLGGEEYSLAEPGVWPWIARVERIGGDLSGFPAIRAWMERLAERPEYREELEILERAMPLRSSAAR